MTTVPATVDLTSAAIAAPADTGSPEWWRDTLLQELRVRQPLVGLIEDYFQGRHPLNFQSSKFREVFADMLAALCDNWMPLIINAAVERMSVQGFRFGGQESGDQDAWGIWQRNGLDADSTLLFTEASKHGEAYLLVWPDDRSVNARRRRWWNLTRSGVTTARVTVEHPSQMIVETDPGDRRERVAALKTWRDRTHEYATLWLPDRVHRWQRAYRAAGEPASWEPNRTGGSWPNPYGVVPVIPVVNQPAMIPQGPTAHAAVRHVSKDARIGLGRSDLIDVLPTQDEINAYVCDMLVAAEVAAYRQRWATGLEVPRDPETKQPLQTFEHAINRLWVSEAPDTRFGEFSQTELRNFTTAIESRLQSMASRTRTPPHYLISGMGTFPSGESLKATETGLVSRVKGKFGSYGESLEEAMRIAFLIEGNEDRAGDRSAETIWASPEVRSESEFVDSLTKKMSLGVPVQQLWEDAGYSPQQIQRFRGMLLEWAMLSQQITPPPAASNGMQQDQPPEAEALPADDAEE
jgi:hypothetical protein